MSIPALSRLLSSRALAFTLGFAASLFVVIPLSSAKAQELIVKYDQSQLLRLPRPVSEIIIGNPTIADVTVQANNLLVVTGKTFGVTNVIALDAERNVIMDQRVMVIREEVRVVNVQKGIKRESYNCAPNCNPSMVVGDDPTYFEAVGRMSERKIKFTEGNVETGAAQGGNQ
ncbi:MAG: pilus assembly protein N-terminal domain-containing protein [Hyphomicrobiaceae bacterium]